MGDWFAENRPSSTGEDWFASNAPVVASAMPAADYSAHQLGQQAQGWPQGPPPVPAWPPSDAAEFQRVQGIKAGALQNLSRVGQVFTECAIGRALGMGTETASELERSGRKDWILRPEYLTPKPGFAQGAAEFLGSFTSTESLALLAGTGGLGALSAQLGNTAVTKAISATFSVDMLKNAC